MSTRASVYRGPLEEFVRRRDALAKELRSAGDRELATTVKNLRKPSRIAWALDQGALEEPDAVEPLAAAVAETLDAHSSGQDVRAAMAGLRSAVREFASRSAHAAERAGHRIEPGTLASAVLAVLGRPESLAQLRDGCLADVPEGGGLDFLAGLAVPSGTYPATPSQRETPATESAAAARTRLEATSLEAARHAARALAAARSRAQTAQQALRDAETMMNAAVDRLRQAEEDVRTARSRCDRARQDAEAAAAQLRDAEGAVVSDGC